MTSRLDTGGGGRISVRPAEVFTPTILYNQKSGDHRQSISVSCSACDPFGSPVIRWLAGVLCMNLIYVPRGRRNVFNLSGTGPRVRCIAEWKHSRRRGGAILKSDRARLVVSRVLGLSLGDLSPDPPHRIQTMREKVGALRAKKATSSREISARHAGRHRCAAGGAGAEHQVHELVLSLQARLLMHMQRNESVRQTTASPAWTWSR